MQASPLQKLTIALDAMGGDNAPDSVLEGANRVCQRYPNVEFLIFGDGTEIQRGLTSCSALKKTSEIIHTDDVVLNEDKPSIAIRQRRNSSMGKAIKAVRKGRAVGVVSGGNTGALMGLSKIMLGTLPGIDRPAIGGIIPTKRGECVMLDLGANVYCDANNLFEFAVMGDAFARALLHLKNPSVGLLNIGSEEMKGNDDIRQAALMLRESEKALNFFGHVEGDDINEGVVDVVVTDGFSGNIALKTIEGTAKMCAEFLKQTLTKDLFSKLGASFLKPSLNSLQKKLDPRLHNGAMLLGLNGIVVKSHGGSDAVGFGNAVVVAIELALHNINEQIVKEMVESGHIDPLGENEEQE